MSFADLVKKQALVRKKSVGVGIMRVVVAGAGALGSVLGGYVARCGEDVLMIARDTAVAAIRANGGVDISGIRGEMTIPVEAAVRPEARHGIADLVILGVKSQDVEEMLEMLEPVMGAHTQILSPQNGVATEDMVAARYGKDRSLPAVTPINASYRNPGHMFHGADDRIDLGPAGGQDRETVEQVVAMLRRAGFAANRRDDVMQLKWRKLALYCVGSIVNALTDLQRLDEDHEVQELMRDLAEEIVAVVEATRCVPFAIRPLVEEAYHHFDTFHPPGHWLASVGQDLRKGKHRTEIEYLNGYIVKLGRQCGVRTPVNHCMYTLVKGIESTGYLKSP